MRIRYKYDETDPGMVLETKRCEAGDVIFLEYEKIENVPNITLKSDDEDEDEFIFIIDHHDADIVLDSLLRLGYADLSGHEMYYNPGLYCKDSILEAVANLKENHH